MKNCQIILLNSDGQYTNLLCTQEEHNKIKRWIDKM